MTRTPKNPAARPPRPVRVAQATVPGEPAPHLPPRGAGGKTSPQLSRERAAEAASCKFQVVDLPEKIAGKITVNADSGCWDWHGYVDPDTGYGRAWWEHRTWRIHRLVYTLLVDTIPDGLELDHVKAWGCVSRSCCWPGHLEPVTSEENSIRAGSVTGLTAVNRQKTHCPKGHPYDEQNTRHKPDGARICKACSRIQDMRNRGTSCLVKLPLEIAETALYFSAVESIDLSSWVADLVQAEISRRVDQSEARTA